MSFRKDKFINPVYLASSGINGIIVFASFALLLAGWPPPFSIHQDRNGMIDPTPINERLANIGISHSWLALGDSYTIGESVKETDRYPVLAVRILGQYGVLYDAPEIIARTGWTTGDLLQATREMKSTSRNYDVVTLLIGVNNQYQGRSLEEYKEQFTSLLKRAIELAGDRVGHVVVLSIPDYGFTPFARSLNGSQISGEIDSFNRINKELALQFGVQYLDITGESRKTRSDPSLIAGDGLHFSGKEYAIWAKLLADMIKEKVK